MSIAIFFRFFACARFWTSQKMAITIGAPGEKVKENGMTNTSQSVLKMHIRRIGVSTAVLAFMLNFKHKGFIVGGNELHG